MKVSGWNRRLPLVSAGLLVALALGGCGQHANLPATEDNPPADQHLPFAATSDKGGIFPTGSLTPTAIPSGTALIVHLLTPLSSAASRTGDTFEASLDETITVRGQIVAPRGATVAGKILEARPAGPLQDVGYMRFTLTAISVHGQSFSLRTSSIFVKGGTRRRGDPMLASGDGETVGSLMSASAPATTTSQDVSVTPQRRLTFRLAQPTALEF